MALLAHDVERPFHSKTPVVIRPDAANAHAAMAKRVLLAALTILLASGALAGIIALKTTIYFARFHLGSG